MTDTKQPRGDVMDTPSKRGTNPRGIELKDALRRKLEVANAEVALWRGKYDDATAQLADMWAKASVSATAGMFVGVLLGWWLA